MSEDIKNKSIDWNKKNATDNKRFDTRIQKKSNNKNVVPRATGVPLQRLKRTIKEIYHQDDEEDNANDIINTPVFHIGLIEDEENNKQKKVNETLKIAKQQELTSKLSLIMNTAIKAEASRINTRLTAKDEQLSDIPEYDLKKIKKKTIEEKIEKPLKINGKIPENKLEKTLDGIKNITDNFAIEELEDMTAQDIIEYSKESNKEELAELILKKTGKNVSSKKKSLFEIAEDLNRFKDIEQDLKDKLPKE